jgi:hypothetical protein
MRPCPGAERSHRAAGQALIAPIKRNLITNRAKVVRTGESADNNALINNGLSIGTVLANSSWRLPPVP